MTYLAGIHAALWLLGALTPFAAAALLALLALAADVPHRVRVLRLRRELHRTGRGITVRNSDGTGFTTAGQRP